MLGKEANEIVNRAGIHFQVVQHSNHRSLQSEHKPRKNENIRRNHQMKAVQILTHTKTSAVGHE